MKRQMLFVAGSLFVILGAGQFAFAQVVYDDGATHTIPGDPAFMNGQSVWLQAASGLVIEDSATVVGAEDTDHKVAGGGVAVLGQFGTTVDQQGGEVTGGRGQTEGDALSSLMIRSSGGAGVWTTGDYNGSGGFLTGGFGYAASATDGASSVSNMVMATGGEALRLLAGATASFSGVELQGGEADARFAHTDNVAYGGAALVLDDSGLVVISSGQFTGGTGTGNALVINNASAFGMGGAAIDVLGSSQLTIDGGSFHGGVGAGNVIFFPAPSVGVGGAALRIIGPASVTINDGAFVSGSGGAVAIPPAVPVTDSDGAIRVIGDDTPGDFQLTINGGSFSGYGYALQTFLTSPEAASARIDIHGGDFDNSGGGDISLGNPDIVTTIYGSDFQVDGNPLPMGPVSALSGTLTGLLVDGSPFAWDFERTNGATLHLADGCDTQSTDISAFVVAVLSAGADPSLLCMFDANSDGALDGLDVQGFVERILGP